MKQTQNITTIFPKHLFWDMNYDKLNLKRDMDIIIPRALFATTKESFVVDIEKLEKYWVKLKSWGVKLKSCIFEIKNHQNNRVKTSPTIFPIRIDGLLCYKRFSDLMQCRNKIRILANRF